MKYLDQNMLTTLMQTAAASPRQRANHNIHPTLDASVQRFFNALQPETYVRPHRHRTPPRWELFLALRGRLAILVFDDAGCVIERQELSAQGPVFGAELPVDTWHALVALEPCVIFELKEGPYHVLSDKDFATWAPAEDAVECASFIEWYRGADVGAVPPAKVT